MMIRCLWVILFLAAGAVPVFAQEKNEKKGEAETLAQTTTTAEGIQFRLPEDWPVVKRGGGVGPAPIEEYLAIKFNKIEARFQKIEERLSAFEEKAAEAQTRKEGPRFRSGETLDEPKE